MRMNFKPNQAFIKQTGFFFFFSTCLWTAHEFTGWIHTLDQVYYSQTQEEECVVKSELPHITSPFFPAREGGAAPHDTRAQLTTVGNYEISFNPRAAGLTVMSRQHSATTPRQHWWRGFLKKAGGKKKGKSDLISTKAPPPGEKRGEEKPEWSSDLVWKKFNTMVL